MQREDHLGVRTTWVCSPHGKREASATDATSREDPRGVKRAGMRRAQVSTTTAVAAETAKMDPQDMREAMHNEAFLFPAQLVGRIRLRAGEGSLSEPACPTVGKAESPTDASSEWH